MPLLSNVEVTCSTIDSHEVLVRTGPVDRTPPLALASTDVISNLSTPEGALKCSLAALSVKLLTKLETVCETAHRGSHASQPIDVGPLSVNDFDAVDSVDGWLGVNRRLVRRQLVCEPVCGFWQSLQQL